jgi:hypothetical protein
MGLHVLNIVRRSRDIVKYGVTQRSKAMEWPQDITICDGFCTLLSTVKDATDRLDVASD